MVGLRLGLGMAVPLSGGGKSFNQKVIASNPLAFWPLNELSGTNVLDAANGYDCTSTNVTVAQPGIGDGETSYLFNGSTSYINIGGASGLAAAINGAEGSIMIALKADPTLWGLTFRRCIILWVNGNNYALISSAGGGGGLAYQYKAGGTIEQYFHTTSSTDWNLATLTWSKSNDRVRCYFNASNVQTLNTLGIWVGTPLILLIGANSAAPANVWLGNLAKAAIWTREVTPTEVAAFADPFL